MQIVVAYLCLSFCRETLKHVLKDHSIINVTTDRDFVKHSKLLLNFKAFLCWCWKKMNFAAASIRRGGPNEGFLHTAEHTHSRDSDCIPLTHMAHGFEPLNSFNFLGWERLLALFLESWTGWNSFQGYFVTYFVTLQPERKNKERRERNYLWAVSRKQL